MEAPTAIACDFDFTLACHRGGFEYLYELFTRRGVAREDVMRFAREVSENQGFSIGRLVSIVKSRLCIRCLPDERNIANEFYEASKRHVVAYPEAIDCLWSWRRLRIPVHIVTKGERGYQKHKTDKLLRIPYDFIHCVEPPARKYEVLRILIARYGVKVLFIDDRTSELDDAFDHGLSEDEVITVRIVRPEDPYGDGPARYSHHEIFSLTEVLPRFFGK